MGTQQLHALNSERPAQLPISSGRLRFLLSLLTLLFLMGTSIHRDASGQAYTSIVVFGDSLSDVGNDASLSFAKYGTAGQVPGPITGYTNGRFTDGADTTPAARNYFGIWIEQLAARLTAHPAVQASLNGGSNYAYGYATTNTGTSQLTYGPNSVASITVNNMGQQLSDYLATGPAINSNTLYVVWGGANDLLNLTNATDIANSAAREVALVQQLIAAGATDFLIPNLPPLGLVPRLNQMPAQSAAATGAAQVFNQALSQGLAQLGAANSGRTVHLFQLDVYTLFNTVVGPPPATGFTNVTSPSSSFFGAGNATVNPDTYLFWDDLHPTTFGHSLIAAAALTTLGPPVTTTVSLASNATTVNLNSSIQFTATVVGASSTPTGTVTFLDGSANSTALGSALVLGSTTTATGTATFSTSALTAGTHTIHASFAGVNGYTSATSANLTVTVTPPAFQASASPTTLTITRGGTGTSTITIAPTGGYTGSFTVACGALPAKIGCSIGTANVSITGTSSASSTVTINTNNVAANHLVPAFGLTGSGAMLAVLLVPGPLYLSRRRRAALSLQGLLRMVVLMGAFGALAALSGCGGDPLAHDTPAGTYQIPVTVTPASGSATTLTLAVTVQ